MKERNDGIELLRIVSMFMIVNLHLLGKGGLLENTALLSGQYCVSWFLELASTCSVNCYALISGAVGYRSKPKLGRILNLWFQVVFYTVFLTGIFMIIDPTYRDKMHLMRAVLPVSTGAYWYVSCYFGMFFLIPIMNKAIEFMERKQFLFCLIATFALYTVIPTALNQNPFALEEGYSVLWLCLLYLAGAYISKYNVGQKLSVKKSAFLWFVCVLLVFIIKMGVEKLTYSLTGTAKFGYIMAYYTMPLTVVEAVLLLICFSKLQIHKEPVKKGIRTVAATTFGIYVIHLQSYIFYHYIGGCTADFADDPVALIPVKVLTLAVVVFVVCSLIDFLRKQLFRLLRLHRLSEFIENRVQKLTDRLIR